MVKKGVCSEREMGNETGSTKPTSDINISISFASPSYSDVLVAQLFILAMSKLTTCP